MTISSPPPEYWAELEAFWEGRSVRVPPVRPGPVRSGALAAAVLLGMGEVLTPVRREQAVIEVEVDVPDRVPGRVHVWLDPGSARRSFAIVGSASEQMAVERSLRSETVNAVVPPP